MWAFFFSKVVAIIGGNRFLDRFLPTMAKVHIFKKRTFLNIAEICSTVCIGIFGVHTYKKIHKLDWFKNTCRSSINQNDKYLILNLLKYRMEAIRSWKGDSPRLV